MLNTFLCFSFFSEKLPPEEEDVKDDEHRHQNQERNESVLRALGGDSEEQEEGESQSNRVEGLVNEIVRGRRFKSGIDLPEKDHARAGRSGEHPEEGKEGFVLVIGKESVGKLPHIEISKNCPHKADYY